MSTPSTPTTIKKQKCPDNCPVCETLLSIEFDRNMKVYTHEFKEGSD